MFLRALLFWFGMMVLAILNVTVRVYEIIPFTGDRVGHWISTAMLCALILMATWAGLNWLCRKAPAMHGGSGSSGPS